MVQERVSLAGVCRLGKAGKGWQSLRFFFLGYHPGPLGPDKLWGTI